MGGAERHNTRHVGVGVRVVIRLVPWDNPRQASGTRVRCQVRPNPDEAVYAAAQPYPGKELGQRCVCTQRKAASWMRPVRHWCSVPVYEDGPGSLRR